MPGKDSFNIDNMTSKYRDFARSYLYYLTIDNAPAGLWDTKNYPFLVNSTSAPQSSVGEIETNWQGNVYKLGSTRTFEDFTVTFKVDTKSDVYRNLRKWVNLVHDPETNVHGNPATYANAIISLEHLDGNGDPIAVYKLHKAWCKTCSGITFDYGTKDVATFEATFAYQYSTEV
jgi:hypothetical protein